MKSAIIAGVVAMLVSSASATAAFVVTSKNIKNGTIQTVDISAKAKKALKGKVGPAGARGPAGPTGFVGATRVVSATFVVPSNTAGSPQTVACPAGTGIISGGVISESRGDTWLDAPSGNGWSGAANNVGEINPGELTVYALCAQGVGAPSTSSASASSRTPAAATRKAASQTD